MVRAASDSKFIRRLEEIIGEFPSRAALAKKADLPPSSLQSYIEGAEPTRPALVALARAADVSLEWLADNRGYKKPHPPVPDGYAEIPVYDIRKSGGYVYPLVTEEVASWIYMKLDLFKYPRMQPPKLFVVEALGSRAPEIVDGDLLVVDSSWRTRFVGTSATVTPGNYLVSRQAKLSIREVIGVHGDSVEFVESDAPSRKEALRLGEEGFTVHGRIIWYGRSLPMADAIKTDGAPRVPLRRKAH
jgi:phage repressor protein C with HTH and peptisase S24 domain